MSIEDGKIDNDLLLYVNDWFKKKGVSLICPMCKNSDWSTFDCIVSPVQMIGSEPNLYGRRYPTISIVCENCANVQQFNAIHMGLAKPDLIKPDDNSQSGEKSE